MSSPIRVLAGARARRLLARDGLTPQSIVGVAAAAGGPKGLALLPLDHHLFGEFLPRAPRPRTLVGASIGAWRMAAAAQRRPGPALQRLQEAYLEIQRYPARPSAAQVSQTCREVVRATIGGDPVDFLRDGDPTVCLQVITARATRSRSARSRTRFAHAAFANALSRDGLARHLQRVVFATQPGRTITAATPNDRFDTQAVPLEADNLEDALLASGSIPLVAEPVNDIVRAPPGAYWDGGLIDYHVVWHWQRLDGLVLIPHFGPRLTAGWFDKFLPWRRHALGARSRGWLENVVVIAPSPELLARLPGGRLPERQDFHRFGTDHDARIRQWRRAIAECERLVEAFERFAQEPARLPCEPLGE